MTPQRRDRMMQVFLAQARGPRRNGDLLRQAVDRALRMRAIAEGAPGDRPMDDALLDTLGKVVQALDDQSIPYAVTGSVAGSAHGKPWQGMDADLLILASASRE